MLKLEDVKKVLQEFYCDGEYWFNKKELFQYFGFVSELLKNGYVLTSNQPMSSDQLLFFVSPIN